jgi:hypothetical protein
VATEPSEVQAETPNGAAGERPASVEADTLAKSIVAERRAYRMLVDGWRSQLVWLVLRLRRLLRLLELLLRGVAADIVEVEGGSLEAEVHFA